MQRAMHWVSVFFGMTVLLSFSGFAFLNVLADIRDPKATRRERVVGRVVLAVFIGAVCVALSSMAHADIAAGSPLFKWSAPITAPAQTSSVQIICDGQGFVTMPDATTRLYQSNVGDLKPGPHSCYVLVTDKATTPNQEFSNTVSFNIPKPPMVLQVQ